MPFHFGKHLEFLNRLNFLICIIVIFWIKQKSLNNFVTFKGHFVLSWNKSKHKLCRKLIINIFFNLFLYFYRFEFKRIIIMPHFVFFIFKHLVHSKVSSLRKNFTRKTFYRSCQADFWITLTCWYRFHFFKL